jgi:LDH2 family malate/lactate/ureidoglycolate dehydrogenase
MDNIRIVPSEKLGNFCREILVHAGVPGADASIISEMMVEADLRGVETHGVRLLPAIMRGMRQGRLNPRPAIKVLRETGATVDREKGEEVADYTMNYKTKKNTSSS